MYFAWVFALVAYSASGETLSGRVVAVHDGDTITVLVDRQEVKIRLHGVDCPELGQPFGRQAKKVTSEAAFGKNVRIEAKEKDRYGRTVADVYVEGRRESLNHAIVRAGFAWWYRKYAPKDTTLEALEREAREAKRGLWQDAAPVPPWEWQASKR